MSSKARIAGWAFSELGTRLGKPPAALVQQALAGALRRAGLDLGQLDGLLSCPSLADQRFMWAHHLATECGVLPAAGKRGVHVATIDNGGASPVSMLLQARALVESGQCSAVAVVAGDSIASLDPKEFLRRADASMHMPRATATSEHGRTFVELRAPAIPHGYAHCAEAHMQAYGLTRRQLAMVSVLMSAQASRHPRALQRTPYTLDQVLGATAIAPHTGLFECARKSDGAAAVIITSSSFASAPIAILGGAETGGPVALAQDHSELLDDISSAASAFQTAYSDAGISRADVDYFGLYDCFPICFVRAVEAAGLAPRGEGGKWVEDKYDRWLACHAAGKHLPATEFPVNTHGGLLAFGAPWEVPALFSIVEACEQLTLAATEGERQVPDCKTAAVYGNGGVFTASAVAILRSNLSTSRTTKQRPPEKSFMQRLQEERALQPSDAY